MKAKVLTQFRGVKDGEVYPQLFNAGDVIEGELARAEVANGRAEEVFEGKKPPRNKMEAPKRNKSSSVSQPAPASRKKTAKRSKKAD